MNPLILIIIPILHSLHLTLWEDLIIEIQHSLSSKSFTKRFEISDSMFSSRSWNIFRLKVLQPLSPQAVESSNLQDIRLTGIGREPRKPTGRPEVCTPTKATKSIWKLPVEDTKSTYVQPELFSSRMEIRLPPI